MGALVFVVLLVCAAVIVWCVLGVMGVREREDELDRRLREFELARRELEAERDVHRRVQEAMGRMLEEARRSAGRGPGSPSA